jgi:hypothetical protein
MQFEIIWRDGPSKVAQKGEHPDITEARRYARIFGRYAGLQVLAVLPLPTREQEENAVIALSYQFYAARQEREGDPDFVASRRLIQRAVQEELFFGDHRAADAYLLQASHYEREG